MPRLGWTAQNSRPSRGVDGFAVHAVMVTVSALAPNDLAANHHRVDGSELTPKV